METSEATIPAAGSLLSALNAVSEFYSTQRCTEIKQKLEDAILKGTSPEKDDHRFLSDCRDLSANIKTEINATHKYIHHNYLEAAYPIDCERIKHRLEPLLLHHVDLGSPATGKKLKRIVGACDRALALDSAMKKLLDFVESKTDTPNLSALVGPAIARKLVRAAGGLSELSMMPPHSVFMLGVKRENLASSPTMRNSYDGGYLGELELLIQAPPNWKIPVRGLMSENVVIMARYDITGKDPTGNEGRKKIEEIRRQMNNSGEHQQPGHIRYKSAVRRMLRTEVLGSTVTRWSSQRDLRRSGVTKESSSEVCPVPVRSKLTVSPLKLKKQSKSAIRGTASVSSLEIALQGMKLAGVESPGSSQIGSETDKSSSVT